MTSTPDTPKAEPSGPPLGVIARVDRTIALMFAARGALVLALLALIVWGFERMILAEPGRYGFVVAGLPTDRLVELRTTGGQIVLIGDSVVQTVALTDEDRRTLDAMLGDELGAGVHRVSQAATAAELHAAWLRYLEQIDVLPTMVVIEVNPRSFSANWDRNPPWLFFGEAALIDHPLFARLATVLEWDYGHSSDAEYHAAPIVVQGAVVGTLTDLEQPAAPEALPYGRYLVRYASDYSRSRRVAALHELVDEANACPFPVVLYITPIDVGGIHAYLPPDRWPAVEQNLDVLRAELARSRWPTVDASELVEGTADFDHPIDEPHEHIKAAGRLALTHALVSAIGTMSDGR